MVFVIVVICFKVFFLMVKVILLVLFLWIDWIIKFIFIFCRVMLENNLVVILGWFGMCNMEILVWLVLYLMVFMGLVNFKFCKVGCLGIVEIIWVFGVLF